MLNAVLLSFFYGAPAFIAVAVGRGYASPAARGIMVAGGTVAVVLVVISVLPMLGCSGDFYAGFGACVGGAAMDSTVSSAMPVIRGAAMIYILVCVPLGLLAWLIETLHNREPA